MSDTTKLDAAIKTPEEVLENGERQVNAKVQRLDDLITVLENYIAYVELPECENNPSKDAIRLAKRLLKIASGSI